MGCQYSRNPISCTSLLPCHGCGRIVRPSDPNNFIFQLESVPSTEQSWALFKQSSFCHYKAILCERECMRFCTSVGRHDRVLEAEFLS